MNELKKYSTAQLVEELCGRAGNNVVVLKCDTPSLYIGRPGKKDGFHLPKNSVLIGVKPEALQR